MELISILFGGLITGILIGLFPVFPIYFGAFVIYLTAGMMSPEQMLLFWIVAAIGSQFFGSVSAISLGIPGDASSLPYINDVKSLTLDQKQHLLWSTSRGSLISASLALILVWLLYQFYSYYAITFLSGVAVKIVLLYAVILGVTFLSPKPWASAALAVFGIFLSPQNNYGLPDFWYHVSVLFQHTSFFMLVIALLVIPDLLDRQIQPQHYHKLRAQPEKLPWRKIIKNAFLGCGIGLVPGPAAEIASATAYGLARNGTVQDRILAAETANNPGVIMMLLPLLTLGIPFTASGIIMANIMDSQLIELPVLAGSFSEFLPGATVFDAVIVLSLLTVIFYYILSIRFIDIYVGLVAATQNHLRWLLMIICLAMITMDMHMQEITAITYFSLLIFFTVIGVTAKYFRINTMALIFCFLLGDQVIWSTQQFFLIYF